ncbi:hypothetical protein [Streptomyces chumphonensis]|uniref:hypothetical protein n=1 Tax=Streptomyces chumphonensis TaxID=1214925 RepID=UPI003D7566B0
MGWRWLAAVTVNLLLGVLAIVPLWLLWYFAINWPLQAVGLTDGAPTENDGMLPWLLVPAPILLLFTAFWVVVNLLVKKADAASRAYWVVSAGATLLPTLALLAAP